MIPSSIVGAGGASILVSFSSKNFSSNFLHSETITDQVTKVATPLGVGNFIIECIVEGIALSFLIPECPSITLYGEGDLTTANFMIVRRYNPSLSKHTSSSIFPNGFMASPANPTNGVFVFVSRDLMEESRFKKQCSYITSTEAP